MTPLLGFCGASGSGKTTLVSRVIRELTARGLKVGAIKHHGHPGPLQASALSGDSPNKSPKDSDVLAQAGARRVALCHAGGVWVFAPPLAENETPAHIAAEFMQGMDLVLVEGFKTADIDKIEVVAPGKKPILPAGGKLIALARRFDPSVNGEEAGLPVLNADAPQTVADFVLQHLQATTMTHQSKVALSVNGVNLDLNPFVAHLLNATIKEMVKKLKGGANPKKIEVSIID